MVPAFSYPEIARVKSGQVGWSDASSWMVQSVLARKVDSGSEVFRCTMKPKVSSDSGVLSLMIDSVTVAWVWPKLKVSVELLVLLAYLHSFPTRRSSDLFTVLA